MSLMSWLKRTKEGTGDCCRRGKLEKKERVTAFVVKKDKRRSGIAVIEVH